MLNFLSTIDTNIFDVEYYDLLNDNYINEIERLKREILNRFNTNVEYSPTVIIGDKYTLGFNDTMEQEYIESIYRAYRNEIEITIKK